MVIKPTTQIIQICIFTTVNLLKSTLPWTALNISILFNLHLQMSNLRKTRKLQILLVDFYKRIVMPLFSKKKEKVGASFKHN